MSYWVRLPTSGPLGSDSSPDLMHESADESSQQELSLTRPIVFLHGVGLGLVRPCTSGLCPALGGRSHALLSRLPSITGLTAVLCVCDAAHQYIAVTRSAKVRTDCLSFTVILCVINCGLLPPPLICFSFTCSCLLLIVSSAPAWFVSSFSKLLALAVALSVLLRSVKVTFSIWKQHQSRHSVKYTHICLCAVPDHPYAADCRHRTSTS